jgi:hypothetical protein
MDEPFGMLDPRVQGVCEQHARAKWFCALADDAKDTVEQFRLLIAAVYFSRAVVELMLDAAEVQALREFRDNDRKKNRSNCEAQLAPMLSHYLLIERIRIHDFHRFGCVAPHPTRREIFLGGGMKLTASKGAAVLSIPASGPQVALTGNSSAKDQRSLCSDDGSFFDDVSGKYVPLRQILDEYLRNMPVTIAWFEEQMAG